MAEKRCTRCGITKPLEEFTRNRWHADGRQSYCRVCNRRQIAQRRAKDPQYREEGRAYSRAASRAKRRLARLHRADYRMLLAEELAKERRHAEG